MSIEATHYIFRGDAIESLRRRKIEVFDTDSNERLEHELYKARPSQYINYCVVDYKQEDSPDEWIKSSRWASDWPFD